MSQAQGLGSMGLALRRRDRCEQGLEGAGWRRRTRVVPQGEVVEGMSHFFGDQLYLEGAGWGSGVSDPGGGGCSQVGGPAYRFLVQVAPRVGSP